MALKKLVSDLTEGLTAYPNSNTPSDSGGFNYGGSTSIFDTKVFNQRSIPYSQPLSRQDNPEPLIPQILPGVNQEPNESTIFITDSPDGFIRGGETNAIKRAATDTVRMNKFFISGEGVSFISNQKALQRSNPLIQEGGGNVGNILEDLLNGSIGTGFNFNNTNRTFNEGNLIKQISEGGYTGTYFNRAGSNPEIQAAIQNKYEATHKPGRKFDANKFGNFSNQSGLESGNRLISLGKKLGVGSRLSFNGSGGDSLMQTALGFDVGTYIDTFNDIKNNFNQFLSNPLESLSQPGPFSPNPEIGFKPDDVATKIDEKDETLPFGIGKVINPTNYLNLNPEYYKPDPNQISKEGRKRLGEDGSTNVTDTYDGEHYYSKILSQKVDNDSGRNYTFESRLGAGRPGILFNGKLNNEYSVTTNKDQRIDKINALDIHRVKDETFTDVAYRDLIRFRFEAIDTNNPTEVDAMVFRAFLDSYGDSYNSEWNNFKYNGRGEDFYTYGGFKRSVNFGFKIAAQSRFEMKPLYRKLNYLATTLAPDYAVGEQGVMRGNFIRVTIGALLDRVPGFLTSMDIKWQKDYPFEIAIANPETGETDNEMQVLPHVLDISCNFTPIHDFVPRKSATDSPFFATTQGFKNTARDFYKDGIDTKTAAIAKTNEIE